tara:strand:- start:2 stop:184 length:183 start_codon:yes stop_codon:yes gene_type:complete
LGQLKDEDQVIRVDINKLTSILKQKSNHLKATRFISPITFGIPNELQLCKVLSNSVLADQ